MLDVIALACRPLLKYYPLMCSTTTELPLELWYVAYYRKDTGTLRVHSELIDGQ